MKVVGVLLLIGCVYSLEWPEGAQGPPGTVFKYDLLSNSQPGINYPGFHLGAFVPRTWPQGLVNNELQEYKPENAHQESNGAITITAKKEGSRITSARLETYGVWSTALSSDTKKRGYVEVRTTMPVHGYGSFRGAWPAIWMLGNGNGNGWPKNGEIDIVEAVNGDPKIYMNLHSPCCHGGNGQKPSKNPFFINSDLSKNAFIAGFEWNVRENIGQIDLTWWHSWLDSNSNSWQGDHTTKVLYSNQNNDYWEFLKSFNEEGFSLIINLAQGGDFPQVFDKNQCLTSGPQYMNIQEVKVYGF